jgi:hypothetical protein
MIKVWVMDFKARCCAYQLSFDFKTNCFICGKLAVVDSKHPDRCAVSSVCTKSIYANMLKLCSQRGDHWAFEVQG